MDTNSDVIIKDAQIAILKAIADTYPYSAESRTDQLAKLFEGNTLEEKQAILMKHLKALEEFGYIEDLYLDIQDDTICGWNSYKITAKGLLKAGIDIVHPASNEELVTALVSQAVSIRSLSIEQKQTFGKVLSQLPLDALKHLQEKGLDYLLGLIFP